MTNTTSSTKQTPEPTVQLNLSHPQNWGPGGLGLCLLLLALLLSGCSHNAATSTQTDTVMVDPTAIIGPVPKTAFGVNTAVWDSNLLDPDVPGFLQQMGAGVLRFPGGSTSDVYHWQTNSLTVNGGYANSANTFDAFMGIANKIGATPIITVNYGSNPTATDGADPNEAAGWVNYANNVKHYGVQYWEIGNEVYGNGFYGGEWEEDMHAPDDPSHKGRQGNAALGPDAYGRNAVAFIRAMKAKDPGIKIGVFLIQPGNWPDGQQPDWNSTVLSDCGSLIDFAIVHLYPESPGKEDDAGLLASTSLIPDSVTKLRSVIDQYCGARGKTLPIFLTETNSVSFNPGKQSVSIVNALFLPDDYLTWLESGVANVDWWDLHNGAGTNNNNSSDLHGSENYGDYGLIASGSPGLPAETPYRTFYAMKMMTHVARPGDLMLRVSSGDPMVAVHAAIHDYATLSVLLINKDPSRPHTVTIETTGFKPPATATVYSYGENDPDLQTSTIKAGATITVTLPPYTMQTVVLSLT